MSQDATPTPPSGGIFIPKGTRLGIPTGGFRLSITETGEVDGHLDLHAALDVTPHWFSIAAGHLAQAEGEHPKLVPAWQRQDNDEISRVLEAEFVSSMQAMMAAATAIDTFYAAVKEHVPIQAATLKAWREKGTARHKQVYEVLRRGFKIGKAALPKVREALSEIYRFRDLAVHPSPKLAQPLRHPDLGGVGTEWRFVYFRYENAKPLVSVGLGMVVQLLEIPKDRKRWSEAMLSRDRCVHGAAGRTVGESLRPAICSREASRRGQRPKTGRVTASPSGRHAGMNH